MNIKPTQITLSSLILALDNYLASRNLSPISRKLYLGDIRKFLYWLSERYPRELFAHIISPSTYQDYLSHLRSTLSDRTVLLRVTSSLKNLGDYLALTYHLTSPTASLSVKPLTKDYTSYLTSFLNYLKKDQLSDLSIKSYKSDVKLYLEWAKKHYPSNNISSLLTDFYIKKYLENLTIHSLGSQSTINRKAQSLKRFSDWYQDISTPIKSTDKKITRGIREKIFLRIPWTGKFPVIASFLPSIVMLLLSLGLSYFGYRQLARDRVLLTQAYPSSPITPNRQISFQGRLETSGGTPITTATNLVFKLWNDPSGGTQLYTTGTCSITPDSNGVFSTQIGSTCGSAISSSVFTENANVYLEVTVGSETLSPRQQIATVAYALNSETLQGFPISATVSAVANTVVPMNQWGEIIIGEQSPRMRAVSGTYNISAPALSLTTNTGTSGNITLTPDGTGQVNVNGNTTTANFFNVSNAQLTTGSLITGTVGNNNTGFKLIDLSSGTSPTSKFSVDANGLTNISGDLYLSSGLSTFGTAVSDGTVEATKFCTSDGETNCITDFSALGSKWTDAGSYLYPTASEVLGNSASAGTNKLAGIYLSDSSPLVFGTDNDISLSYISGTQLALTGGLNISGSFSVNNITLSDNTANALQIKEGSNVYLDITTTNDSESFSLNLPTGGATSHTANLFTSNIAQTINIGTGTAIDTINIGTGVTGADDINIGGTATSHTDFTGIVNLAGGTTYKIDASGNATFNDLVALDTGNPGLTIGNGSTGYFKIGGSTISDPAGNLTFDSDTNAITIASSDTTLTASNLATFTTASALSMGSTSTLTFASNATINGGAAANDDLILQGTSNATRTSSYVILQPNGGNVGIGTSTPSQQLDVSGSIRLTGSLYDNYVTAGIRLGNTNETTLSGFGATSIVGALNELKNVDKNSSHNDYVSWAKHYQSRSEGSALTDSEALNGLFFDTFEDGTKLDSVNTTTSLNTRIATNDYRVGLMGGQTYNSSTTDNDGQTYLGSNTVVDIHYYDRTLDSSPEVLVELGIDPNWYNGVTLSVATTSANQAIIPSLANTNSHLSTTYNGSLLKVTGTDNEPNPIFITIKTPTTFDWTNYQGDEASNVTITPGQPQSLGATGVSVTFTSTSYNVGDVFKIHSWYIEPESTTRGTRQQFPERSYLILESTYLDIIDADTQKLWMRFSTGSNTALGAGLNLTSVEALNGAVFVGGDGSGLRGIYFSNDQNLNYYAGIYPKGTVANRNINNGHVALNTTIIPTSVYINDVSAAVIPNIKTQEITVTGWGYFSPSSTTETITMPYNFRSVPNIVITSAGHSSTTAPTSVAQCTNPSSRTVVADNILTSKFTSRLSSADATNYQCYTWEATGIVAPKFFIALATGPSGNDGAVNLINLTDTKQVDLFVGSQIAAAYRPTKTALTSYGDLYLAIENSTAPRTTLDVYHGVAGLTSSETSIAQYRHGFYTLNNESLGSYSANGPRILGSIAANEITSLRVGEHTSTKNPAANTIYVGTSQGLTVIQEQESLSNEGDGAEKSSGSVKYFTKDYISEEMIGDIRGMWPLSANGSLSMSDATYKANTLTNNGSATAISGIRGVGVSLNGISQYLSCTDASCGSSSKLDPTATISIGAWVKTTDSDGVIIAKYNADVSGQYHLSITSGKCASRIEVPSTTTLTCNRTINDGQWHHIVTTYNGSNQYIYVDGQLDNSQSLSGSMGDSSANFSIGAYYSSGTPTNYLSGSIDEPFVSATIIADNQIKQIYQVGYRALQSHSTSLAGGSADTNQQLQYASTGTNNVGVAIPDFNNQYLYVGLNSTTLGGLTKIALNSDTAVKKYLASNNTPSGGTTILDEDINSLAVGYQLEAVGSAASGVKSMAPDNNANNNTGTLYSKPQTLSSATKFAFLWLSGATDNADGSSTITPYACNAYTTAALCTSNSAWVAGTLIQTDSSLSPPEKEYNFSFTSAGSNLIFRFDISRGSSKTNTYLTRYGASWGSSVGGADIAERYQSSEPVYPGDIVAIDSPVKSGLATVKLSNTAYDQKAIGVVTTNPGIVMDENLVDLNFNAASRNSPDRPAIALAGRVPVKVTSMSGPIKVGDPITTSSLAGYGQKALSAGIVIGRALEDFDCTSPSATPLQEREGYCTGKVLTFVNITHFEPSLYLTQLGDFIYSKDQSSIENYPSSTSISPVIKLVRVLADGSREIVDRLGTFGAVVTGTLKASNIQADLISPLASDSAVSIAAPVIIRSEQDPSIAALQVIGDLEVTGEINSATISARTAKLDTVEIKTLVADKITANNIEGLEAKIASISADRINSLSEADLDRITSEIRNKLTNLVAMQSLATDLPVPENNFALSKLDILNDQVTSPDLSSDSAIISTLSVNTLFAADLSISHSLNVSSIESYTELLALGQNTLIIDQKGLVTVNGNLTVSGDLVAQSGTFNQLTIGSPSTDTDLGKLISIYNQDGIQVASLDASGSATLNELSTKLITIASAASSSGIVTDNTTNATAGDATIVAGETSTTIYNPFINPDTLIYLTPTTNTANKVIYVSAKSSCSQTDNQSFSCQPYFTVSIDTPTPSDIHFNWWIIQLSPSTNN